MTTDRSPTALLCFDDNYRILDNACLKWAAENNVQVCALALIRPQKRSPQQITFLNQSILELKKNLLSMGVPLHVCNGNMAMEIEPWLRENTIDYLVAPINFHTEQELNSDFVKAILEKYQTKTLLFEDRTLLKADDLPFKIENLPSVFSKFRNLVESSWKVREIQNFSSTQLKGFLLKIPESSSLHNTVFNINTQLPFNLKGGETAAWSRVHEYLWETHSLSTYKNTRNGLLNKNDSFKISAALARGCISPRALYWEIKKYESEHGANESTYWMVFELLWRDYFKFLAAKNNDLLFSLQGYQKHDREWKQDSKLFAKWTHGSTGNEFIDANMIELKESGWMSNRGRQNVASYLAKHYKVNWTWGAEYFAETLIDYDIESNWGNWQYLAGVGNDPRDRIFNPDKQANDYDPHGLYRAHWLNKQGAKE